MNKRRIPILCVCLLICLSMFSSILSVSAEATLAQPSMEEAAAVYFYHLETDTLVVSKNTEAVINAGSTSKVIAGLLACEQLADRMEETVVITSNMVASSSGYRLYIKAGDELSVEQLLYAALCGSYNDAYDVLACLLCGSVEEFVSQMNAHAAALGAKSTHFTDVSGIADSSVTTAADMAKIALAAYQNELYMKITGTARYAFQATLKLDARTVYNRNALISSGTTTLYYNEKCRGMSAGYTERGGSCVITVADNGKEHYLSIVMGAPDTDERNYGYTVTNRLIDWVYSTYTYMEVVSPNTVICTLPVTVSDLTSEVEVRTKDSLSYYLPTGLEIGKEITYSVRLMYSTLEAPVSEGMMVGYVAVLYNGKNIGTLPIYTAGTAERSSFVSSLKSIQALTQSRVFRAGAIFFVIVLVGWITVEYILHKRRRHKWDKYFSAKRNSFPDD